MKNTLNQNCTYASQSDDLVYVNPTKPVERFDIIIVNYKSLVDGKVQENHLIKRAIAFGGEYITIRKSEEDGYYHIFFYDEEKEQAQMLNEDYVRSYADWTSRISYAGSLSEQYEGKFYEYYLSGANSTNNQRNFTVETFDGISYLKVPDDEIFFLGDNRDDSMDARFIGPSTLQRIEGVAEIILTGANKPGANVLGIKIKSIFSYYWNKLAKFFAR